MCTLARGKQGKHWYEYRYAASSLGTLSRDFLRKFAWAVGGAAGQQGWDSDDENAGSQHLERETHSIWCDDSYTTRPAMQASVQRKKRTLDAAPESSAAALVPTSLGDVIVPPMKIVWPSDLQIKGMDPVTDDENLSEGSQPDWVLNDDVGRRVRQSFLLSGADNALADVSDEIEAVRAEQQLYREGILSHAKVLSCHLCSRVDARGAGTATSAHTGNTEESTTRMSRKSPNSFNDENLAWLYVGSANLSAAAWGRPLNSLNKHDRNAAAGALDNAAVCPDTICCCCTGMFACSLCGIRAQTASVGLGRGSTVCRGGAGQDKAHSTLPTGSWASYCGHRMLKGKHHSRSIGHTGRRRCGHTGRGKDRHCAVRCARSAASNLLQRTLRWVGTNGNLVSRIQYSTLL